MKDIGNEIFLDKFGAIFDNSKDSNGYILSDSIRLNEIIQKFGYNNPNYTTTELSIIKDNIKYYIDRDRLLEREVLALNVQNEQQK